MSELEQITAVIAFIGEIVALVSMVVPMMARMRKLSNGTKCQLRSEMLHIYYRNIDDGKIRQYEYENFVMLYEAYKALGGNSFIDRIYEAVKEFEIVT